MPSNGERTPPKTWYTPLNPLVLSKAYISAGTSTTHINLLSLLGSPHIVHGSFSVIPPHKEHAAIFDFTSLTASDNNIALSFESFKT